MPLLEVVVVGGSDVVDAGSVVTGSVGVGSGSGSGKPEADAMQ